MKHVVDRTWASKWPHFKPEEVLSPSLLEVLYAKGVVPYSHHALNALEDFRVLVDSPVICNTEDLKLRGGRGVEDILKLYGKPKFTYHSFCAFDISCPELEYSDFITAVEESGLFNGIGYYPNQGFIHVDTRCGLMAKPVIWTTDEEYLYNG